MTTQARSPTPAITDEHTSLKLSFPRGIIARGQNEDFCFLKSVQSFVISFILRWHFCYKVHANWHFLIAYTLGNKTIYVGISEYSANLQDGFELNELKVGKIVTISLIELAYP